MMDCDCVPTTCAYPPWTWRECLSDPTEMGHPQGRFVEMIVNDLIGPDSLPDEDTYGTGRNIRP